jgi:hypothetical protein
VIIDLEITVSDPWLLQRFALYFVSRGLSFVNYCQPVDVFQKDFGLVLEMVHELGQKE